MVFAGGAQEQSSSGEEIILTFGCQDSPSSNFGIAIKEASAYLEEISGNTMKFEIFPSSQLGDFKAMTAQLMEGELALTGNGYPDMSYLIPELQVVGAPYVVTSYEHLLKVIDSPYGQEMNSKMLDMGVRLLDTWYFGTRQTTSNRPIYSIEDFDGMKLRVPEVDFLVEYAKAVGAIPAPVAFSELYLALQTNQVDAQENPLPTIDVGKLYEVQKNLAITNHFIASKCIFVSDKIWSSLTSKQQEWLMEAIAVGREINNEKVFDGEKNLIEVFEKEHGVTFTYPDLDPFREAMKSYYDKLNSKHGAGIVEQLQALE